MKKPFTKQRTARHPAFCRKTGPLRILKQALRENLRLFSLIPAYLRLMGEKCLRRRQWFQFATPSRCFYAAPERPEQFEMQIYMAGSLFKPMHRSARRITGLVLMAAGAVAAVAQNEENSERAAAPPRFSVPGGIQTNEVVLRLTAEASSTVIRYTVDGSEPGLSSLIYGESLTLTNSILIKARGFASNAPPSATVSQTYTRS